MSKLKIKSVNHGTRGNRYCGPAVLSAITGMTTGDSARLIRHVSGRKAVRGTSFYDLVRSFQLCGIEPKMQSYDGVKLSKTSGPTLAQWLKMTVKERTADRVFLIVCGWHWQLVQGRRIVCGILKDPTSIRDKRVKRRRRVAAVWELTCPNKIIVPTEAQEPKRERQRADNWRARAQRLAKQLGVEIEIERYYASDLGKYENSYWLHYEGDTDYVQAGVIEYHSHYSWSEVLDSLESIKEFKSQ